MINSENRLTCAQVKAWDMVDYLAGLGHRPEKINANNYWYLSPLREEKTASFKVNRAISRWYDHGTGKGGNLIDFAILYYGCTVAALLSNMQPSSSFHRPSFCSRHSVNAENKIEVLRADPIHSVLLVNYLKRRHIPVETADKYCREVSYRFRKKTYSALGFRNDAGGYELRNPYYKNSSRPKSITTIRNGAGQMAIFEGFFDFLSFVVIHRHATSFQWDFCILNSLSFFDKTITFLHQYNRIHLYLDNDTAGQNCSLAAVKMNSKYVNESKLFDGYKDINEWLVSDRKMLQKSMRKHLRGGKSF